MGAQAEKNKEILERIEVNHKLNQQDISKLTESYIEQQNMLEKLKYEVTRLEFRGKNHQQSFDRIQNKMLDLEQT